MKINNWLCLVIILLSSSSCANKNTNTSLMHKDNDPFEPYNRFMFATNEAFYNVFLDPVVYTYRDITPNTVKTGVNNVFDNIGEPLNAVNNVLQTDFPGAYNNVARFAINSTVGIVGFFDIASDLDIEKNNEDFGKTLAVWGVGEGPYFVIPILGGYNLRDTFGIAGDYFMGPFTWILHDLDNTWAYLGLPNAVTKREKYIDFLQGIKKNSIDFYTTMKETTRQNRRASINKALGIKSSAKQYDFDMDNFEEE